MKAEVIHLYLGVTHDVGSDIMVDSGILQNTWQSKICFYLKALLNHLDVVKHALYGTLQVADAFLVAPTDQDPQTTTLRFQIEQKGCHITKHPGDKL